MIEFLFFDEHYFPLDFILIILEFEKRYFCVLYVVLGCCMEMSWCLLSSPDWTEELSRLNPKKGCCRQARLAVVCLKERKTGL